MWNRFALAALAGVLVCRGSFAQIASGPTVTLGQTPAYTNIPQLDIDAVIGDNVEVQAVSVVVVSAQKAASFPAAQRDGGSAGIPDGGFGDGGFGGGIPDGGFGGGIPDGGFGDGGLGGGIPDGGITDGGFSTYGAVGSSDGGFSTDAGVGTDGGFSSDGGVGSSDGGTPPPPAIQFTAWHALVSLFEGANSISAVATDVNGVSAGSVPQMVVLDSIPPDVHVVSPAPGQVFGTGRVDVNLTVSDATPTTVFVLSPDGGATITPDSTGTVTTVANFPAAGAYALQIVATDSASNTTSLSVPVFIDLNAPVLTTALPDGQQSGPLPGAAFPWTVNVADLAQTTVAFSPGQAVVTVPRGGGSASAAMPLTEGVNLFHAGALSESGHGADLQRSFTYDTTPPTGSIEVPGANAAVRGTIELTVSAQDALTGVASVELGVNGPGTFAAPAGNGLFLAPFDTRSLADGPHTAVATLTDGVGNATTLTQPFVSDNTPPQVGVASPAAGAFVGGTITLTATAQDATTGIALIELLADGQPVGGCAASPCSVAWATAKHGDGPATVSARAADGAGNTGVSAPVAVTVDNSAPSGFLVSPVDGAVVEESLLVAVKVEDADFDSVSCAVGDIALGPSSNPALSAVVDLSGTLDGPLSVSCTARDAAGNAGTQSATVTVRKWELELTPEVLKLRATGGGVARLEVEGPGAGLLIPIALRLGIAVPGGPLVPVLGAKGGTGRAVLLIDRAALVDSLRAGASAGAFTPPSTVKLFLRDGTVNRGQTRLRVR